MTNKNRKELWTSGSSYLLEPQPADMQCAVAGKRVDSYHLEKKEDQRRGKEEREFDRFEAYSGFALGFGVVIYR